MSTPPYPPQPPEGFGPPTQPLPPSSQPPGWGPGGPPPPSGPPVYGGPPGAPPGYGPGAGGPGFGPPGKSSTGLVVLIVVLVLAVIGAAVAAYFLLRPDPTTVVVAPSPSIVASVPAPPTPSPAPSPTEAATQTEEPTEEPTTAAPTTEATEEPTGSSGGALAIGDSAEGTLAGAPVSYTFAGTGGETVTIMMTALDSSLDPRVRLVAPDGTVVGEDDDGGPGFNAQLEATLPADGTYIVEATSFGSTTGDYVLTLRGGSMSAALILGVEGTLDEGAPEASYTFDATAGQTVEILADPLDDAADPTITVLDPSGAEIDFDDDGGVAPLASRLELTLPADGTYTVVVGAFGSRYGQFSLRVSIVS